MRSDGSVVFFFLMIRGPRRSTPVCSSAASDVYKGRQGRLDGAQPLLEEALAGYRAALGEAHPDTLRAINNLGLLLQAQGRLDEAQPLLEDALACPLYTSPSPRDRSRSRMPSSA